VKKKKKKVKYEDVCESEEDESYAIAKAERKAARKAARKVEK
jgi:hypothetical protein